MKTRTIALLSIIALFMLSTGLSLKVQEYEERQMMILSKELALGVEYNHFETVSLGDVLYNHVHTIVDELPGDPKNKDWSHWGHWLAGYNTPSVYKQGQRSIIANNPWIVSLAIKKYGKQALISFKEELSTKDGYNPETFWKEQRLTIEKYNKLILELSKLDDKQLNQFISEIGGEQSPPNYSDATNAKNWLFEKGLISEIPTGGRVYAYESKQEWSVNGYPLDLLFFVYRANRDYPEWSPREILQEGQKVSAEISLALQ